MNTRAFLAFLAGLLVFAYQLPGQVVVLPDNPWIEYTGRVDFSNPKKPAFGFSGVAINCKFSGSSVKVRFSSGTTTNYYFYSIDESEPVKIHLAKPTTDYLLSNSLTDTLHRLTLVRLTEGSQGTDIFEGIILDNGASLATLPKKNRKIIEFYGNSITCGYGNETTNTADGFKPEQENFYYTYASDASRLLDADCIGISISGIGMYRNYGGPVTGSPDNMLTRYDHILFYDNNKKWDFTGYTPDVVCINLGTNDTSTGLFDEAIFADSCRSLLEKLRNHYPDARIVYLTGPMMNSANTKKVTDAVQGIFHELNDPKLSLFQMSIQTGEFGFGGDYHPTVAQHWKNALELVNYLKGITGWPTAPYFANARVAVDGMSVLVNVTEALADDPPVGGTEILADGVPIECLSASLSGVDDHRLIITLSKRIREGQDVRISYKNGEIRSYEQVRLLPFYDEAVSNPVIETQIVSAAVNADGNIISCLFNKRIAEIQPDSFLLLADGDTINSVSSVALNPENDHEVEMAADKKIFEYQTINLDLFGGAVTSSDGIMNDAVMDFPVSNNSLINSVPGANTADTFVVFPNPAGDRFMITGSKTENIQRIELYDGTGRLVAKFRVDPGGSYDMAGLAAGIYYCRIFLKDAHKGSVTMKIVKR